VWGGLEQPRSITSANRPLTRRAGGGQQFFASLIAERKRFIARPRNIRKLTGSLDSARHVDQMAVLHRSNFPGMKLDRRYIGRGLCGMDRCEAEETFTRGFSPSFLKSNSLYRCTGARWRSML